MTNQHFKVIFYHHSFVLHTNLSFVALIQQIIVDVLCKVNQVNSRFFKKCIAVNIEFIMFETTVTQHQEN